MGQFLHLVGEPVGQPGEAPHPHPHGDVLALDVAGRDQPLRALLPRLGEGDRSEWRHRVEDAVESWWRIAERRARRPAVPLNPQLLFHELSPRLPDDTLLAVDVGSVTYWYARHIRMRGRMAGHLSSTLASMGPRRSPKGCPTGVRC